jgi:N-acetylglutamate synthase-like GNAT family acetyltransferase
MTTLNISNAQLSDIPALNQLIVRSARELSRGFYTEIETEAAIQYVFGVDTALVQDGTYFKLTIKDELLGCGGWSQRRTMYGGDQRPVGTTDLLDPKHDAARIRAFFIAPEAARRGVGSALFNACKAAAQARGFQRLELMATLPGVPFYSALGFQKIADLEDNLPNGVTLGFVHMSLDL